MAILDLDKIIFKKPDTGIHCINCGGDLREKVKMKLTGKIIAWITFGKVRIGKYQCENCKKKYIVL